MLFVAGIVLLGLGILSGAILVLAPLGLIGASAGFTLWILFPVFTIAGYLLAAVPSQSNTIPVLTRVSGVLLLLLALIAAVALVLQGGSIMEKSGDTFSLWYVLGVGLVLGAMGVATHRKGPEAI